MIIILIRYFGAPSGGRFAGGSQFLGVRGGNSNKIQKKFFLINPKAFLRRFTSMKDYW